MTDGMKSSEFYVTIFSVFGALLCGLYGLDAGEIGAALLPAVTYIGGRSYVKKGVENETKN